jgi:hypothetical protein
VVSPNPLAMLFTGIMFNCLERLEKVLLKYIFERKIIVSNITECQDSFENLFWTRVEMV